MRSARSKPYPRATEAGFVLVDSLVAVVLAAVAGSLVYAIGGDLLTQQDRLLDRSMALATVQMLGKQLIATSVAPEPQEDSRFTYVILPEGGASERQPALVTVEARAKDGDWTTRLSFVVISR